MQASPGAGRGSRFWLYAPFILLAIAAAAWSAGWYVVRGRAVLALDEWIERERQAGRQWACPGRTVGGFPFRIEIVCPSLAFDQPELSARLGRVTTIAQVYQPRHVIAEAEGPLRVEGRGVAVEGTWRLLQASVRYQGDAFQRASVAIDGPNLRVDRLFPGTVTLAGNRLETHVRPSGPPGEIAAYEASARAEAVRLPLLDEMIGGTEPADLAIRLNAREAQAFGPGLAASLERWRARGGTLDIAQLSIAKGARRVEAKGVLRIDDERRPAGRLEGAAAGLEGVIGTLIGGSGALGALVGALTGRAPADPAPAPGAAALKPLPPVRLEGGRVFLGPVAVPRLRLQPLY